MKPIELLPQPLMFVGNKPGPALLIFGAVHGNETCGTKAIQKIIKQMKAGKIVLRKGSVCFVPIANPKAYAAKKRYINENLNRIFKCSKNPQGNEGRLANLLGPLIDNCDAFLDIHSTTAKGAPFIYLDYATSRNRRWAKILGPQFAVKGWPELYRKMRKAHLSLDTTTYAAKRGKDCLLIECGQHEAATAPKVAYQAILNSLIHFGLVAGKIKNFPYKEMTMTAGYFRENKQDKLAGNWKHLDRVRKGDPLILKSNGKLVRAAYDAFIIMPKATAPIGDDWLYLAK